MDQDIGRRTEAAVVPDAVAQDPVGHDALTATSTRSARPG